MHFLSTNWRTILRVGSLALLCLFCASIADASTSRHRRARSRMCDQRTRLSLRGLASGRPVGPVAPPSTRALSGLGDSTLLLQHGHLVLLDDGIAAISNDAPAAQSDDLSLFPAFQALGLIARTTDRLPLHDTFSPRSPRGPPAAA
jgi:hypothetical protein